MTALRFRLNTRPAQRIDVSPLIPERLAGLRPVEIAALPLQTGNHRVPAGALFAIDGDDPEHLVFEGDTGPLDRIGQAMRQGDITVEGDAGSYLGFRLQGGAITVAGSIDAYGACEMKSGTIVIRGDAGDFLGAALPGNHQGMAGGSVLVQGKVGHRAGDHLRRGSLFIEGEAGDYLGARMTAGTIAVLGRVGNHPGYAMNRGTLLLAAAPATIPATFNDCGTHTLGFIPLLLKSAQGLDTRFVERAGTFPRVRHYVGDLCALGKGEPLVALRNH